jgi:hypothetical protein
MPLITSINNGYVPTIVIQNIVQEVVKGLNVTGIVAQSQVTGLVSALASKANSSDVVLLAGDQLISGIKQFSGKIGINQTSPVSQLHITAGSSSTKGLIVKSATSQTANLTEWQNNSGNPLTSIDSNGIIISNLQNNASTRISKAFPPDVNSPVTYNHVLSSFPSGLTGGNDDGIKNSVYAQGWNIDGGGGQLIEGLGYCRDGWESHYSPDGTVLQWERHVGASFFPGSIYTGEVRPITIRIEQTTELATVVEVHARTFNVLDEASHQIGTFSRDSSSVNRFIVWNDDADSSNWFPFLVTSSATQDTVDVGRLTSANTKLTIRSSTGSAILLTNSSGTAVSQITGTTYLHVSPTGGNIQFRTSNFLMVNEPSTRIVFQAKDDGTQAMIGFLGATPVGRQVLATGASHTVDDVITLLQTLGLCKQS